MPSLRDGNECRDTLKTSFFSAIGLFKLGLFRPLFLCLNYCTSEREKYSYRNVEIMKWSSRYHSGVHCQSKSGKQAQVSREVGRGEVKLWNNDLHLGPIYDLSRRVFPWGGAEETLELRKGKRQTDRERIGPSGSGFPSAFSAAYDCSTLFCNTGHRPIGYIAGHM